MPSKNYLFLLLGPFLLCSILSALSSCSSPDSKKEALLAYALDHAGNNRAQWTAVLHHYAADSLKSEAARFLIRNLPAKGYLTGPALDEFHAFIDSVYQIPQEEYDETAIYRDYRRKARFSGEPLVYHADLQEMQAIDLIRHIDEAFLVWQKPWNRSLSFEEFCEWVLPYRVGNELAEHWRPAYRAAFASSLTDSVTSATEACRLLNRQIRELPVHIFFSSVRPSDMRPSSLIRIKFGLCEDYAALAVLAMRAAGIPVSLGIIPHWGRGNNQHTFNILHTSDGYGGDFSGGEEDPGEHLKRFEGIPKVYRKTFAIQPASLLMQCGKEEIPPFFRDPCLEDVTGFYPFIKAQDITVDLPENCQGKRFAYLCVFDPAGWTPVDWGRLVRLDAPGGGGVKEGADVVGSAGSTDPDVKGKAGEEKKPLRVRGSQVHFRRVGPDVMYQVAIYDNSRLIPLTPPFYVDTCGKKHSLSLGNRLLDLTLERKQKESSNLLYIPPTLVGGKFQGSNDADFRRAEDLYLFTQPPVFKYTSVAVSPSRPYRYYRYLSSAQTQGNMAEVEFREAQTDTVLRGRVIGTDKTSIYHPEAVKENVFDGDGLTYFHTRDSLSWAGLALSRPALIHRVRFLIRNDDNGVRKGNVYELKYIGPDFEWVSAGRKMADDDDRIVFERVPEGTLYWLRNLTRGKEERIFTYENGRQIWW